MRLYLVHSIHDAASVGEVESASATADARNLFRVLEDSALVTRAIGLLNRPGRDVRRVVVELDSGSCLVLVGNPPSREDEPRGG